MAEKDPRPNDPDSTVFVAKSIVGLEEVDHTTPRVEMEDPPAPKAVTVPPESAVFPVARPLLCCG